jgi:hypothetical protein
MRQSANRACDLWKLAKRVGLGARTTQPCQRVVLGAETGLFGRLGADRWAAGHSRVAPGLEKKTRDRRRSVQQSDEPTRFSTDRPNCRRLMSIGGWSNPEAVACWCEPLGLFTQLAQAEPTRFEDHCLGVEVDFNALRAA